MAVSVASRMCRDLVLSLPVPAPAKGPQRQDTSPFSLLRLLHFSRLWSPQHVLRFPPRRVLIIMTEAHGLVRVQAGMWMGA